MSSLRGQDAFPFAVFTPQWTAARPVTWLQNGRDHGHDQSQYFAAPNRRVYIDFSGGRNFDPLCHAALDLMERDLAGHADRHDPFGFRWILTTAEEKGGHVFGGNMFVNGAVWSGETEGVAVQFNISGFQSIGLSVFGRTLLLPIGTSQRFNWSVLDGEDFERLIFRLYSSMDFERVQWLQRTRAPDSGRDISANRLANGNRVLIQARHQAGSLTAPDVNKVVVKAETWSPPFDEVIIVTSSAFTQEAVRWAESHNAATEERPTVTLEPHGHLEVMLTKHPQLIAHLGLR